MTLKFRAWLKREKKMVDVKKLTFVEGKVRCVFYRTGTEDHDSDILSSACYEGVTFKLMQSTGLKDINDKEIYEGDVIIPDGGGASLVHWRDGAFQVGYYGDIPYVLADYKSLTVIGNIYENPELKQELMEVIE